MLKHCFLNACALAAGLSSMASTAAIANLTEPLPGSDRLAQVAQAAGTQLSDGNISTGTTLLSAALLVGRAPRTPIEMKDLARKLFAESFKRRYSTRLPDDAKVAARATAFRSALVSEVALALAVGNAYNTKNPDNIDPLTRLVWAVLRKLPVSEKTWVGVAKTRLANDDDREDMRELQQLLFLDRESRRLVQIFVVEGTM